MLRNYALAPPRLLLGRFSLGTQVQPLCWEDLLEKEMAAHSIILAWKIPGTEEPGGLQSMGSHESRT